MWAEEHPQVPDNYPLAIKSWKIHDRACEKDPELGKHSTALYKREFNETFATIHAKAPPPLHIVTPVRNQEPVTKLWDQVGTIIGIGRHRDCRVKWTHPVEEPPLPTRVQDDKNHDRARRQAITGIGRGGRRRNPCA